MNCPFCNSPVDPTAFYCGNCGKKIREKPLSTGFGPQIGLYLASVFLPPLNLPWTIRYLKSPDAKAKTIGLISLAIMIASIVIALWLSYSLFQNVQKQINQTLNGSLNSSIYGSLY